MKTEDTEKLDDKAKPSKSKAWSRRLTCNVKTAHTIVHYYNGT